MHAAGGCALRALRELEWELGKVLRARWRAEDVRGLVYGQEQPPGPRDGRLRAFFRPARRGAALMR